LECWVIIGHSTKRNFKDCLSLKVLFSNVFSLVFILFMSRSSLSSVMTLISVTGKCINLVHRMIISLLIYTPMHDSISFCICYIIPEIYKTLTYTVQLLNISVVKGPHNNIGFFFLGASLVTMTVLGVTLGVIIYACVVKIYYHKNKSIIGEIKYCNSVSLLNDSTYTALVACTGRHHLIDVVHIQLLSFVQDGTIEFM
jgi:hypothetical protein